MHRIDTDHATIDHKFIDSDPGTVVDDDFMNALQEELCAVVEGGGIALVKGTNTQLLAALHALFSPSSYSPGTTGFEVGANGKIEMWGRVRATYTSEPVVAVSLPTSFASSCDNIQITGVISSANISRDLWPQIIEGTRTTSGFSVQLQNDDGSGAALDGFDWRALGR
jgi:hypothetical protein